MTAIAIRFVAWAAACAVLAAAAPACAAEMSGITVKGRDCADLIAHIPAPDVAYRPGVDAHGKPAAPADLGGTSFAYRLPDTINIPITVELAERLGIPAIPGLYKAEADIGLVEFRLDDGRAWLNGLPLTSDEAHVLARACRQVLP